MAECQQPVLPRMHGQKPWKGTHRLRIPAMIQLYEVLSLQQDTSSLHTMMLKSCVFMYQLCLIWTVLADIIAAIAA